jgi:uncharacterized protein (TIGR02266 family)
MRRFNRVNLEELEPVRCRLPFGADVINVGLGGLLLSADQPLPLGHMVGFEVTVESRTIRGTGRVKWVGRASDVDAKMTGIGLEFVELDDESVGVVRAIVEEAAPALRGATRRPVNLPVTFDDGVRKGTGRALDLGPGGLFVQTDTPSTPGAEIALRIELPDGGPPVRATGSVRWVAAEVPKDLQDLIPQGMGVQFNALGDIDAHRIDRLYVR